MRGTTIGDYQIQDLIGSGSMGDVYRGVDTRTGDTVAIKALKTALVEREPILLERFRREGDALRSLDHPNIAKMIDMLGWAGDYYMVMEYVPGGDLSRLIEAAPEGMLVERALSIALDLADALTRAHRLNIIHRDIKPANILLADDGTPRLTDFGVAHFGDGATITATGVIIGTFAYLSPQACMGMPPDEQSDIWSFGVVLYEMLSGRRPFDAPAPAALLNMILNNPLPDITEIRPGLPDRLVDLLYRMLDKTAEGRIPSVRLVGAELESLIKGTSSGAPPFAGLAARQAGQESLFATPTPEKQLRRHNLPVQSTPFVGREGEMEEIGRMLADPETRLITLVGPGGMGKSRLAVEAALSNVGRFPDGVYWVELAPLTDPGAIPGAIAESLDLTFAEDRDQVQQLVSYLRGRSLLLVMDNFEHLLDGAGLVANLLEAAPTLCVMATSRQRLSLSAEHLMVVGSMDFPDWETPEDAMRYSAMQLFMQGAQRVRVDFSLKAADLDYIARICRLVQGMPLGILLAAAWVDTLSPQEIAAEISRSVDFLATDMHDVPDRHQSIRAAFDYSWALLTEDERAAFARMAVFQGAFTRSAAQTITGASIRMLTALVNKSLLQRNIETGWFSVHELIRQLAAEQLESAGEADAVRDAHCQYYMALLAKREPDLKGRDQLAAIDELDAAFGNLRAAWLRALATRQADLIDDALDSLFLLTRFRSRYAEGAHLFSAARIVWPADEGEPTALAGRLMVRYPDFGDDPVGGYRQALEIARSLGEPAEEAYVLNQLGRYLAHIANELEEGIELMEESLALYRELGDPFCEARVLDDIAFAYWYSDPAKRVTYSEQSLDIRRRIGDEIGQAAVLLNLAVGHFWTGDYKTGMAADLEALEIAERMGDRYNMAWHTDLLTLYHLFEGEFEQADEYLKTAERLAAEVDDPDLTTQVKLNRSILLSLVDEDYEAAMRLAEEAYPDAQQMSMHAPGAMLARSIAAVGLGDYSRLPDFLHMVIEFEKMSQGGGYDFAWYSPIIAALAFSRGDLTIAAEILGFYDLNAPGTTWTGLWGFADRLRADLKDALGPEEYQAAFQRGQSKDINILFAVAAS